MIIDILRGTPVWVWLILSAIIYLGWTQTRSRTVNRARLAILPFVFIALSLSGVFRSATGSAWAAAAWALGFTAIIAFVSTHLAVRGATWSPQTQRLNVPGSWWPMALIVGLFTTKYAVAVALALHPELATALPLLIICNLLYGAAAAVFWSRSRSLLRLIPREGTMSAPPSVLG
jgi:hypothetical protein